MSESVKVKGGGPSSSAVSASEMTAFVSALTALITVPETVPVIVTEPVAGVGRGVVPPPPEPPGQALRKSASPARARDRTIMLYGAKVIGCRLKQEVSLLTVTVSRAAHR